MQELLTNEDFEVYIASEIEVGVDVLKKVMDGHDSLDYFRGATEMLKKILRLPLDNAKGAENTKIASALVDKSFNIFERRMMKRLLNE